MARLRTALVLLLSSLLQTTAVSRATFDDALQQPRTSASRRVLQASSTTVVPLPPYILSDVGVEEAETITVSMGPLWGKLCFYSSTSPCLSSTHSFTRDDIIYGNVYYEANGDNFTIDAFLLTPSMDTLTHAPSEYSRADRRNGSWYVVRGPEQLTRASFTIAAGVKRGGRTTIEADWIDSIQDASASSLIQVIEVPKLGKLSLGDRFTVRDLAEGRVVYHQDGGDAGCSDEVVLVMTEGDRYRLIVLQLAIQTAESSGEIISLAVRNATANSSSFALTTAHVDVPNAPYCDSLVRLRITRAPSKGLLLITGTPLLLGDSFTLEDLRSGLVWYSSLSTQTDLRDYIGLALQLPNASNVVTYNPSEARLGIRIATCLHCNQRYTFNVTSHTVQLGRISVDGTFGAPLGAAINVDVQPEVPLQMVFLLFSINRSSPISLAKNGIPKSKHVVSLSDLQNTQLVLTDSTKDNQYADIVRFRIAVLTSMGDVVYSHRVYSTQVQWAKLHMEVDYHTVCPGNSVKASIRVEGFIGEDVDVVVSTWKHLPSDAVCWGVLLPGDVCMTQSSVAISHVTKQSSFLISADQQDLGKRIGVGLQTARNAVKSTSRSQLMVQVTAGSHIGLGPLYGLAPHSPVCNREVEVKEKNGVLRVMLVRMNGLQERAGVICSTTAVTDGATADEDFVSRPRNTSSVVHFDAASSIAYCPVHILDDRRWEPREKFIITLSSAGGPSRIISEVSTLCVYITSDDVPTVSFQKGPHPILRVKEPRFTPKTYQVPIYRHAPEGSLDYRTEVHFRVFQRQSDHATEDLDFQGRPNWNSLVFSPNQIVAYMNVEILNDVEETEGDESFHIEIQRSDSNYIINGSDSLTVIIEDAQDVARFSMVRFLQEDLVVKTQLNLTFVSIPLRRFGNLDQTSRICCILESGTAVAHVDFWKPKRPQREMFPIGSRDLRCSVLVFAKKAAGKSFTVRLEAEDNHTVISTDSMQVHIGDPHSGASSSVAPRYTAHFTHKEQRVLRSELRTNTIAVPVGTSSNFPSNARMTCKVSPSRGIFAFFSLDRGCVLLMMHFCNRCSLTVTLSTSDDRIGIGEQSTTTLFLLGSS